MSESLVQSFSWKISINGKELSDERVSCVTNINTEEKCDGSDTATISVADPKFVFIEDDIFVKEAKVDIEMGFSNDTFRYKFSGYISAIDINFPSSGYPEMSIFCIDMTHLMNRKKRKRTWKDTNSSAVVQEIAQEYGYSCIVEEGYSYKTEKTISQSNVTDIEFCENLASGEREPFMCKLIGGTLYYIKKGVLADPVQTLCYKEYPFDIISFSPRINKETIPEDVSKADINTKDKSVDSATADSSNTNRDNNGDESIETSSDPTYTSSETAEGGVSWDPSASASGN